LQSALKPGFRPLEERDLEVVTARLNVELSRFKLTQVFSLDEARHWFLPRDRVVYSYVVENPVTKEITDFVSFYGLPSTVIGSALHSHINAAYAFYYFAQDGNVADLFLDALISAKNVCSLSSVLPLATSPFVKPQIVVNFSLSTFASSQNAFDVFNALGLMDNMKFIEKLQFGPGDGFLHYYLFNWKCKTMDDPEVGLVLL
jgi:glycylpeptide N-tetradecanoyltransferase